MPFTQSKKTICRSIREVIKLVILHCNEDVSEEMLPMLRKIYMDAKKMNRKLNWYANDGKLPNPESEGWHEIYWEKQLTQMEIYAKSRRSKCKGQWDTSFGVVGPRYAARRIMTLLTNVIRKLKNSF